MATMRASWSSEHPQGKPSWQLAILSKAHGFRPFVIRAPEVVVLLALAPVSWCGALGFS